MKIKESDLNQFTGTEQYWIHPLPFSKMMFTDGVKFVADIGGAYWLLDIIVAAQTLNRVKREKFQVWTLQTDKRSGVVFADNGNNNMFYRQYIEYTDFPLPEIKMILENNVICLPGER